MYTKRFEFMRHIFQIISFFLCFLSYHTLNGQSIRGKIVDHSNKPIPFSTIYIVELTRGSTANVEGNFEVKVPEGKYTIYIRALGYRTEIREVEVETSPVTLDVLLNEHLYEIQEVRVYSGQEDPAYMIMRKAIGLAPYYLNQVKHWKAEVYLKGSIDVLKIPKLFQRAMKDEEFKIEEGRNYVEESLNEITFNAPDKYDQRVISAKTSFPGENDVDIMGYIQSSFYEPTVELAISPLAPNAFSHYNFKYEGVSFEGDFAINKIKVTPKRKSQQLFTGYLYIVDEYWNIHSADLTIEIFIGPIRIKQLYSPVKEDAWLPISYNLDVKAKVLGIKVDVAYLSSVEYSEIEINQEITPPLALQEIYDKNIETEIDDVDIIKTTLSKDQKTAEKIENILSKEEMTNRDMMKLARLMDKEAEKSRDTSDLSLELETRTSYEVEKDAYKRDTTYWSTIRPIPLTEGEIQGYEAKDSIKLAESGRSSVSDSTSKKRSKIVRFGDDLFFGKSFFSKDSTIRYRYDGLIGLDKFEFNTVDGFVYKQRFSIRKDYAPGHRLTIAPEIGYAFNREAILWKVDNTLTYSPLKRGRLYFNFGKESVDFNQDFGINPALNTVASLVFRYNYLRLYEESYFKVRNRIDIANGLVLTLSMNYYDRIHLGNSTDYSFFFKKDRDYEENIPENPYLTKYPLNDQKSFVLGLGLSYTPRSYFRIRNGVKRMAGSDYPTFRVEYRKGLMDFFESQADFDFIETEISKTHDLGMFSDLRWSAGAGTFITSKKIHLADFKHFNTQEIMVLLDRPRDAFMLLEDYQYSTSEWFAEAHIKYSTPFLIIKLLPFFSEKLWQETLYGSYLYQPEFKNYVELGYGLTDVYFVADVGIFVGFEDWSYGRWGVQVSLNF